MRKIPSITFILIPIGALGSFLMAWLTPRGVGIYVDTLYYVSSARNLLDGLGMGRVTGLGDFKPMTHYPPFYSLLLALFRLLGLHELATARWISILAFGVTIVLVGLIIYQRTGSRFFSLFAAVLVLLSNPLLRNFSWAMTEPLYIVLVLSSILLFIAYMVNSMRRWLILAAVASSLALLTRYVGFSLLGAYLIVLLFNRQFSWRRRLADLGIFLAITLVPILVWLVRNWLVSDTLTNRILAWHPISPENISFLIKAINSWGLIPQRLLAGQVAVAQAFIFAIAVGSLFWLWRCLPKPGKPPVSEFVILLASWLYVGLLITSLFTLDATTRLENRILLPLYVLMLLLIIIATAQLWQHKTLLARLPVALICLWLIYFSITRVDGAISDLRSDGQGYASLSWQSSPTAAYIRQQDSSLIYTNDVTAIYFLTDRDSVGIPNSSATDSDLERMRANLEQPGSYLVIFGTLTGEFASYDQLTLDLDLVGEFEDGMVFQNH